ncbi:hypothetical protein BJX68DRAFT_260740 [Aspergillus pseudodeflectus]|uniref:DUF1772-domain-containing protein n=1 Tax=Aspergillus pseudodeflectus TaxID=176178 RepID=A0ABR4LBX2_9EURO
MNKFPTGIRVAQAVGLTGAGWLAGNIAGYSLVSIPALLTSHHEYGAPIPLIVKQWRDMYNTGKAQNPPIAVITAAAFAYLAWSVRESTTPLAVLAPRNATALYSAAAALTVAIVPWTIAAMSGTNAQLLERAGAKGWVPTDEAAEETEDLLHKWTFLNAVRGLFPLVGGVVGYLAL